MRTIIAILVFLIIWLIGWGAWDIRQNNIKSISLGNGAQAGIFDDITDAITGHIDDYRDRSKEDTFVEGTTWQKGKFNWSSDSIHYANGSVNIVKNGDDYYVQLLKDFNAGFAPDLYIYLAEGHISSDAEFNQAKKVELGKLIKGEGASYYKITSYLNGYAEKEFSVVIHCKRFNEPMGAAYF